MSEAKQTEKLRNSCAMDVQKRGKNNNAKSRNSKSMRKLWKLVKKRQKLRKLRKRNFELSEYQVTNRATQEQLQEILQNDEFLCDIPYDCTLDELKGEIALAKGHATTVYVKRDGLSTLTIVLPQENPNIANLRRGIEAQARIQLQREQRQRFEDRMKRRNEQRASNNMQSAAINDSSSNSKTDHASDSRTRAEQTKDYHDDDDDDHKQVPSLRSKSRRHRRRKNKSKIKLLFRNTGELVYSEALSGQQHRPNVSWRFLWRAYGLLNVDTKLPLNDANGRTLLSECGIENATTLKFCNREKYFGRKRQP